MHGFTRSTGYTLAAATIVVVALSFGHARPAAGSGTPSVSAIDAGSEHSCAIKDGGAWCWGWNVDGQIGNGGFIQYATPAPVAGLSSGVTAITAGGGADGITAAAHGHTCAVKDGGVWCWGANFAGQLGNNSTTRSLTPVAVWGLASGVSGVSAGDDHTCAWKDDGSAWCWGRGLAGKLGNNATADSLVPVPVSGLSSGVTAISAGSSHACAVVGGAASCWGDNFVGELGDNGLSGSTSPVPVAVAGLTSGVTSISAGDGHTCAVQNGAAFCWGWNGSGQLGNNSLTSSPVPVAVYGLASGVSAVSAGASHACAVTSGVRCWGLNSNGQLGDNGTIDSSVPVTVAGLADVSSITSGGAHTCALNDTETWCWGWNKRGELGNGSTSDAHAPSAAWIPDMDDDGLMDVADNCPTVANIDQVSSRPDWVDLTAYGLFADFTVVNSTTIGDACNPDIDGDGLPNATEVALGTLGASHAQCPSATANTDPMKLDTDGDGYTDRAECLLGTDPVNAGSKPPTTNLPVDTDHDGLPDALELTLGTDASSPDSDGDKLNDGVEVLFYGSDPLNVNTDGDICTDGKEAASLNADQKVNSSDQLILGQHFGPRTGPKYVLDFDINRDGNINSADLLIQGKVFGPC